MFCSLSLCGCWRPTTLKIQLRLSWRILAQTIPNKQSCVERPCLITKWLNFYIKIIVLEIWHSLFIQFLSQWNQLMWHILRIINIFIFSILRMVKAKVLANNLLLILIKGIGVFKAWIIFPGLANSKTWRSYAKIRIKLCTINVLCIVMYYQ